MRDMSNNFRLPASPEEFIEAEKAGTENIFHSALKDERIWASIPLVNYTLLHQFKDESLVRFRGMVQDMFDPEIYLERYEVHRTGAEARIQEGKYRDCLVLRANDERVDYNATTNVHGERRTLFVVSIPGLNSWCQDYEEKCNENNTKKLIVPSSLEETNNRSVQKRAAPIENDTESVEMKELSSNEDSNKRLRLEEATNITTTTTTKGKDKIPPLSADYLLNSPIPERPGKACMIKVYADFDTYTLNTIVDVVGFLSTDPSLNGITDTMDWNEDNVESAGERQAHNPPPSLIPRIHAIAVHRLQHPNPLLDKRLIPAGDAFISANLNMCSIHSDLRMLLNLCLFNDDLSADYLLSHLISTVYSRSEMQSIGKFTLNICNLPQGIPMEYTKQLYDILALLIPASHYLPLTLETMNTAAFVPKKDYETNKLVSGLLQLAPQTHLVLDETHLQQGKLEANGVMGLQSVAHLINQQQIKCNFHYYEIDYNADIPVLVFSEGRSMLPNDFTIPLKVDDESVKLIVETLKAVHHYLQQPSRLELFRRFLTLSKISTFNMNAPESQMIQSDFVEMRKANAKTSVDDLHGLLVLSRLQAIANGKSTLDKESWELAKTMESKRRQRLQELPKPSINIRN